MQETTWSVRVIGTEVGRATVFARKHQFEAGQPISFDREYDQIAALEYVLGAIGADIVNGFRYLARKRRVEIEQVEANIHAELNNPLTVLGVVGEEGHPGIERLQVKVYVSSLAPREEVEAVWQESLTKSPLVQTFRPAVEFVLELKVVI